MARSENREKTIKNTKTTKYITTIVTIEHKNKIKKNTIDKYLTVFLRI